MITLTPRAGDAPHPLAPIGQSTGINVHTVGSGVFEQQNISVPFNFPAGLEDPVLLVGIGVEAQGTDTSVTLESSVSYGGVPMSRVETVGLAVLTRHQRASFYQLASPPEGNNTFALNFVDVGTLPGGSVAFFAIERAYQFGADVVDTDAVDGLSVTTTFTPEQENSIAFDIGSHGAAGSIWTSQSGQTVLFNAGGDAGDSAGQAAFAGFRPLPTIQQYSNTWTYGGSSQRAVMVTAVYSEARPPPKRTSGRGLSRGFYRGFSR